MAAKSWILIFLAVIAIGLVSVVVYTNKQQNQPVTTPSPSNIQKNLSFETVPVKSFTNYGHQLSESLVINDATTWDKIVNQPEFRIDFRTSTVIAAFLQANTGGYSIKVVEAVDKGNEIEVTIVTTKPGRTCFVTQALTFENHVVKLAKINKPVKFIMQTNIRECSR